MKSRSEVVDRLMKAANDGMTQAAQGTTAGEVLSAYLTLALKAVQVAREAGADMDSVRAGCERILLECAEAPKGRAS